MRIALAHDWLTNYAGAEQILFHLQQTFPQAPIYTTVYNPTKVTEFQKTAVITSWLQKIPTSSNHHQILVPLMPLAINWSFADYDLVLSTTSWAMKGLKTNKKTRHICTILTPTRWLWNFGGDNRANNLLTRPFISLMKNWDLKASQRPDQLIAISETVQKRIKKIYQRESLVIYPPVEVERFQVLPSGQIKDYFLTVGRLVSYKKPDLIVQAFNRLGWPLKVIGSGPLYDYLKSIAGPNVEILGKVDNKTRDNLIEHARAFVFAADEDFGIVPVEAMAAGRPVIAYGAGGATETVIDGESGLFFKEQTLESLIKALNQFDKMSFNSKRVSESVEKFKPARFVEEMKKIINDSGN